MGILALLFGDPWWRDPQYSLVFGGGDDEAEAGMRVIGPCTTVVNENNLKS